MANEIKTDIYDISSMVDTIQKKYMEGLDQDTMYVSLYGYLNEMFSNIIQNSIMTSIEWGNESFPLRAKFERSIITTAINYGIEVLKATPSHIDVMIGFIEHELVKLMTSTDLDKANTIIIDKDTKFNIGSYEFHLDYDLMITRRMVKTGNKIKNDDGVIVDEYTNIYNASYIMDKKNNISDVDTPYLPLPIVLTVNEDNFLFISLTLRQVKHCVSEGKIISTNELDNITYDFTFDEQLADFTVTVKEPDGTTIDLEPIYEGMPSDTYEYYCFYTYTTANSIRLKFDRSSYQPTLNSNIIVNYKTTLGSQGNFSYNEDITMNINPSNAYAGSTIGIILRPSGDAQMGLDKKSVDELKQIIPKEMLSRGCISTLTDLQNYFDTYDDTRLKFFKKRDNQFERLYYAYLLAKDSYGNIIPTNTLRLKITLDDFDSCKDNRYTLNAGHLFELNTTTNEMTIRDDLIDEEHGITPEVIEESKFIYSCPYQIVVNRQPSLSYYLTYIDDTYPVVFKYNNSDSPMQFIISSVRCAKPYKEGVYTISCTATRTVNSEFPVVEMDSEGKITKSYLKPVLILNRGEFKYYTFGKVVGINEIGYELEFTLKSDNTIDMANNIHISDIYFGGDTALTNVFMPESIGCTIALYTLMDIDYDNPTTGSSLDDIVKSNPNEDFDTSTWTLSNIYDLGTKLNLFYNYSNVLNSTIVLQENNKTGGYDYIIKSVPCVRYSYINDPIKCKEFIDYIKFRKTYIDTCLEYLENNLSIDFKFFNTYGPAKLFKIDVVDADGNDAGTTELDRVNIKLVFRTKLTTNAVDETISKMKQSIKGYVEDLNKLTSIHMTNLTTYLTNEYKEDIEFIEFVKVNNYNALTQYLKRNEVENVEDVPEFLNIDLSTDTLEPQIDIKVI